MCRKNSKVYPHGKTAGNRTAKSQIDVAELLLRDRGLTVLGRDGRAGQFSFTQSGCSAPISVPTSPPTFAPSCVNSPIISLVTEIWAALIFSLSRGEIFGVF